MNGAFAQNHKFQAKYLESTAKSLSLSNLDSLKVGSNIIDRNGEKIVVVMNDYNMITHIGHQLFSPLLRTEHPSPVYNYMEFAMLDHKYHFNENPFVYKDMKFIKGSWKDMESINDSTAFSIEVLQNKLYVIGWFVDNVKIVELMIPINYERLSMVNRRELEQNIIRDIRAYKSQKTNVPRFDKKTLTQLEPEVWVKEGEEYLAPEINNNMYFSSEDSIIFSVLFDATKPVETISNLCTIGDVMREDCTIDIKFIKYDYTQESVSVKMKDFLSYMKHEGCIPYWGLENYEENKIEGSLFLYNKDKGFDHILKIDVNTRDIGSDNAKITATAYLLSPTTNVKDLNYKYERKPKKIEIVK